MAIEEVYLHPDDYDLELASRAVPDVPFWLDLVRREGPAAVLEVGCGTGRLTLPLARAGAAQGFSVTGLDAEPPMLNRARRARCAEPPAVQAAVRLLEGDIRSLNLAERFDMVLLPYGMAHHLVTIDDQLAAWRAIHRHLRPGGLLCVDLCAPDMRFLAKALRETGRRTDMDVERPAGRRLRRTVASHYTPSTQLMTHTYEYESSCPGEQCTRYPSTFAMHIYFPRELQLLCRLGGFAVEHLLGSYEGEPFSDESPLLIVLARRLEI